MPGSWRQEGAESVRAPKGPKAATFEARPASENPWATTTAGGVTGKLLRR